MRMPQSAQIVAIGWCQIAYRNFGRDAEISKEAVVTLAGMLVGEETEEEEHIPRFDAVAREVRLRSAGLPEDATIPNEHGVMMTEGRAVQLATTGGERMLAQTEIVVGGPGIPVGGNGQRDRPAVDNGRWASAGGGIEALATEHHLHAAHQVSHNVSELVGA